MQKKKYWVPHNWIETYLKPRYPHLVQPLLECAQLCNEAIEKDYLTDEAMQTILLQSKRTERVLSDQVMKMVNILSNYFDVIKTDTESLLNDPKAHIRVRAFELFKITNNNGKEHEEMLRRGFKDRSIKVRNIAVHHAFQYKKTQLIPELKALANNEKDQEMKDYITEGLAYYLEDGFIIDYEKGSGSL